VSADVPEPQEESSMEALPIAGTFEDFEDDLDGVAITDNLVWVHVPAELVFTADRVERLLAEAHTFGRVAVIEAPPVDDPRGLLVSAGTDATLLVVQQARTRWPQLTKALSLLREMPGRRVEICFNRNASGAKEDRGPEVFTREQVAPEAQPQP
jgi:hypothetical protein